MPHAAFCSECRAFVFVAGDGNCEHGHLRSQLVGLYDAAPDKRSGRPTPPDLARQTVGADVEAPEPLLSLVAARLGRAPSGRYQPRHGRPAAVVDLRRWSAVAALACMLASVVGALSWELAVYDVAGILSQLF